MSSNPLVSAIMPTLSDREEFRRQSIACFESQTWTNRELIVVDGPGTIGAKRNQAISLARGEIIMHWDDDDWSSPGRMADQVNRLILVEAEITGYHSMIFKDETTGRKWKYRGPHPYYALGTSLCYRRRFWKHRPFPERNQGEDNAFIAGIRVLSVDAGEFLMARIHPGNTSIKCPRGTQWQALD